MASGGGTYRWRRADAQRRLRCRGRSRHRRARIGPGLPGGRGQDAGQDDGNGGASGQHRAGDPRRGRPPGPAATRRTPPTPASRPRFSRRPGRSHRDLRTGHDLHTAESGPQAARGRPRVRLLGQAAFDQPAQLDRQATKVCRAVDQPVHKRGARPRTERLLPPARENQNRAQAEDVARRSGLLAQDLLRRQEPGRAATLVQQLAGRGRPAEPEAGKPRPILGQHDVRGVEVPVHDARGMDGTQALGQPGRQHQQGTAGHRPVLADRVGQRLPGHERRRQPRRVAVQIRVAHGGDQDSAHLARGVDLGPEASTERGIRGQFGPDEPDHDTLPGLGTAQEHLSQAVAAKLLQQLVRPGRTGLVRRKRRYHPIPHSQWQLEPFLPRSVNLRSYGTVTGLYTHAAAGRRPDP